MTRPRVVLCTLFLFASLSGVAIAQEPGAGSDGFWSIEIKVHALRMISPKAGAGTGEAYWYLLYDLENKSGEDRDLYVNVTATTDETKKYADLFLPAVERAAEIKEKREFWGKQDQFEILAKRDPEDPKYNYFTLKAGEKKRCIAVFNRFDRTADRVKIHIAGLAGGIEEKTREDGTHVLIERLRELSFDRYGDEFSVTQDSFKLKDQRWVKREVSLAPARGSGI